MHAHINHPEAQSGPEHHMSLKEFSAESGAALADDALPGEGISTSNDRAWPVLKTEESFAMLPIGVVVASLTNPRTSFNEAKLAELTESIQSAGVHQPILVRPLPAARLDDTFNNRGDGAPLPTHEVVSGERRFRASQRAGKATIPAMIRELTDHQVLEIQIVENLQRDDLTELEEAEGYQRLCDATGITKEDIGRRIGKQRGYVYGRLKLLDLSTGPREALRAGTIDASRALLIARIPDDALQLKALKAAEETDHQGTPKLSHRALQTWLQQNVMLKLSGAKFSIADFMLVPVAGACGGCTRRTGANPDLFADVDSPDMCIDPVCFHAKEAAHIENIIGTAQAAGMRVIMGVEAKEFKHPHSRYINGFTPLDSDIRAALTERELKGNIVLFVDPYGGDAVEVVTDTLAGKARQKIAGKQPVTKQSKADQANKEARTAFALENEYQTRWRSRAINLIMPRILADEITSMSANLMRRVLLEITGMDDRVNAAHIGTLLTLDNLNGDVTRTGIAAIDDNHVGRIVLLMLLEGDSCAQCDYKIGGRVIDPSAPVIDELASLLGISVDAIKAEVQDEIRIERAVLDAAAKAPATPPAVCAKAEPKPKAEVPAARPRKTKPTKAQAQSEIALALQALDQAPVGASTGEVAAVAAGVNDMAPVGAELTNAADAAEAPAPTFQTPAITTAASAATDAIAVAPVEIMAGDRVQFVGGLKDTKGHTAKWSGKEGTVIAVGSDALYHVRYGKRDAESVYVELWDLELPPKPVVAGGATS